MKLDTIDKKILYYLDHGGNLNHSNLARKIKRGRDIVEYRVKRLEENNIITGYKAVIDPYAFGFTLYKAYLKLSATKDELNTIIKNLKKEKSIFWIAECSGSVDLIFSIAAKNPISYYNIQARIFNSFKELLISWNMYTIVEFKFFRLKYLFEQGTHSLDFGNINQNITLKEIDIKILKSLTKNSKFKLIDYANKFSISVDTIKKHIATLEKNKLILGYQAQINLKALDITHFKAQIFVDNFDLEEELRLKKYCSEHKYITQYILQIGNCRIEIEIHAKNYEHYNEVISELRVKFRKLIKNVETIILSRESFNWSFIDLSS